MPYPPLRTTENETLEEELPEHIKRLKEKYTDEKEKGEIDFEFWHFAAVYIFRFSEKEFFEETTLRRLFNLTEQYQKFHEKRK